jgi:hypothetical protein
MKPTDPIEGMLIAQAIAAHEAAMRIYGLGWLNGEHLSASARYFVLASKTRARYYAFFPWAFQDYAEHEKGQRGDRGGCAVFFPARRRWFLARFCITIARLATAALSADRTRRLNS